MTYRGDPLKNAETLKEAQVKVLQYFKLGTEKKLVDPTPNKIWLSKKAKLMGLSLKKENLKNLPNAPKDFAFDLSNLSLIDGWSKSLKGVPSFSIEHIDSYSQKINTAVLSRSKKVMQHFRRGEQLLEENFIDIASIYSKQPDTLFYFYFILLLFYAASLKNRTVRLLWHCQCPARKVGTCSHMFAVMKLVAK